jgi:hypothetical protein
VVVSVSAVHGQGSVVVVLGVVGSLLPDDAMGDIGSG